jgi:hypothetical protein
MDNDDEVRDRATYFRAILDKQEAALNSMYILNGMQVPPSRLPSGLRSETWPKNSRLDRIRIRNIASAVFCICQK